MTHNLRGIRYCFLINLKTRSPASCLVPPGSTCLQQESEKGEATREARGAQQPSIMHVYYNLLIWTSTRIAAAFIVSGDRLISRIQYRTFAGSNSISNVDHVTVCHPSSDFRETYYAARKITETSFTPLIQYLARVNTDAHFKSVV